MQLETSFVTFVFNPGFPATGFPAAD